MMDLYEYWLAGLIPIAGRKKIQLKRLFPELEELYGLKEPAIAALPCLTGLEKQKLREGQKKTKQKLQEETGICSEQGIWLALWQRPGYPGRLKDIYNPPYGLFVKGSLPDDARPAVAVVGARGCSLYGKTVAERIGASLAQAGAEVLSGLAAGIDGAGHRGALRAGGRTFGVLGCGIDVCYPAENRELYGAVPRQGGLVSEYPPKTRPYAMLFPQRNRLISGLADVVVVVEAKESSGALITADFALEQGKEVYAVPGRIGDVMSKGANRLIRQGAGIVLSPEDLLEELDLLRAGRSPFGSQKKINLEISDCLVYSCLGFTPKSLDELMEETGISLAGLLDCLDILQGQGRVSEVYKNYFVQAEGSGG